MYNVHTYIHTHTYTFEISLGICEPSKTKSLIST